MRDNGSLPESLEIGDADIDSQMTSNKLGGYKDTPQELINKLASMFCTLLSTAPKGDSRHDKGLRQYRMCKY